jgi:hypothetical protein
MRSYFLEDGSIAVTGNESTVLFNRMAAGVGWPDLDAGYLCVVGERQDGLYHCLWERQGGLWELGGAAREAKEKFLVDCVWVDGRDVVSTSYLRTLKGLCFSENTEEPIPMGMNDRNTPRVRLHRGTDEHNASIALIQEAVALNYRSSLERTREVIMTGRIVIHEGNCPKLTYMLRQPLNTMMKSPVMKGLVWVVTALEKSRDNGIQGLKQRTAWYANPPR